MFNRYADIYTTPLCGAGENLLDAKNIPSQADIKFQHLWTENVTKFNKGLTWLLENRGGEGSENSPSKPASVLAYIYWRLGRELGGHIYI